MSRRRNVRPLEELPSLFDAVDLDMSHADSPAADSTSAEAAAEIVDNAIEIAPEALKRPETVRFISFGSGSSGNCSYVGNSNGGLLIDAGVDSKTVCSELRRNGISPATIAGILLTHDHNDHVRYAYQMLRDNRHMLLFCTPRVLDGMLRRHSISRRIKDYHKAIYKEFEFEAGGFTVTPFDTSHDGSDNMGFHIRRGNNTFVVATDMGIVTERARHYIGLANYLVLESNYDLDMLMHGPYPEYLKARIRGERGHLDNAVSAALVRELLSSPGAPLSHMFLCHLSADNNTPEKALAAMHAELAAAGISVGNADGSAESLSARVQISVLPRFNASPLYVFRS